MKMTTMIDAKLLAYYGAVLLLFCFWFLLFIVDVAFAIVADQGCNRERGD